MNYDSPVDTVTVEPANSVSFKNYLWRAYASDPPAHSDLGPDYITGPASWECAPGW